MRLSECAAGQPGWWFFKNATHTCYLFLCMQPFPASSRTAAAPGRRCQRHGKATVRRRRPSKLRPRVGARRRKVPSEPFPPLLALTLPHCC